MPCVHEWSEERVSKLRELVDELTQMLCGLCRRLEESCSDREIHEDENLVKWWEEHKEADRRREERRRERMSRCRAIFETACGCTQEMEMEGPPPPEYRLPVLGGSEPRLFRLVRSHRDKGGWRALYVERPSLVDSS